MAYSNKFVIAMDKVIHHDRFLNLGFSVLMGIGATEAFMHGDPHNHTITFISALTLTGFTILNTIISFQTSLKGSANNFVESFALRRLEKHLEKVKKECLPYQHKVLSIEEKDKNKAVEQFIHAIFFYNASSLRFFYWRKALYKENNYSISQELFDKHKNLLTLIYKKYFKDSFTLANAFISSCHCGYGMDLFYNLWPIHQQKFNEDELRYMDRRITYFKFKDNEVLTLLTDIKVFSQLSFTLQEKILMAAQKENINNESYNALFEAHQHHDQYQHEHAITETIEELIEQNPLLKQEIVINPQSQKKLDTFEKRFAEIFKDEATLKDIQSLLLSKEKLSFILQESGEKEYIEAKLFLDNDVDKVIKSFNEEISLLIKMKINEHPQFEQYKEEVLDSIAERTLMIKEKMLKVSQQMNDSIEEQLKEKISINKAILKAKM